jgi:hypothetical protein
MKQVRVVGGTCGLVRHRRELGLGRPALVGEVGEAGAELGSPLLVDVVVAAALVGLQFVDDIRLLPLQIFDLVFEGGALGQGRVFSFRAGVVALVE